VQVSRRNRPWKKRAGKDLVRTQVARPRSHVARPGMHLQEATRHQSTSSLSLKANELHLVACRMQLEEIEGCLNCALHGGLIRRRIADPTKKISFRLQ
jgi:hypothetical protein